MKFRSMKYIKQTVLVLVKQDKGQAMTEYAVIAAMIVGVALYFNKEVITKLNEYYQLIADMVSLPIP